MVHRYKTITGHAESLFREKASRFYGHAYPVENEEQVKAILDQVRKRYFDSRHVCFAWVLGPDKNNWKVNDAGEPANTAGKPILGQIRAFDLTNVLVIVVRYFGGTKLGVGGLIQAYKQSALDTLQQATIVEKEVTVTFELVCTYAQLSTVLKSIKQYEGSVLQNIQQENCMLTANIPLAQETAFAAAVERLVISCKNHNVFPR